MKRLFLSLILSLSPFALAWSQTTPASHTASSPGTPRIAPASSDAISPVEWQELRTARDKALKTNPELIESGKQLDQKLRDFQRKIDLAVLKVDPTVAPIVAQMESIAGPTQPASAPSPSPTPAPAAPPPNAPAPRAPAKP